MAFAQVSTTHKAAYMTILWNPSTVQANSSHLRGTPIIASVTNIREDSWRQ